MNSILYDLFNLIGAEIVDRKHDKQESLSVV
jgi:hypothetical protein